MTIPPRTTGDEQDDDPPPMPWDRRPSILEFIRSHIEEGKPGLAEGGYTLPDEERINQGAGLRWAAGAMDGVSTYHMGPVDVGEAARALADLVIAYCRRPTAASKEALYARLLAERVVPVIDPVIEAILREEGLDHGRLYDLARSLATEAPDREPVKLGVALLGLFRHPGDQELFLALGRHDEFTLFCAVALANADDGGGGPLWELARNATGWGRIHAVERLARTDDPAAKGWLLREGFRNSVMNEYLAATCARAGGLLAALGGDEVDRELLSAAGEIIEALISGGPAECIDDYEDARPVLAYFLGHMASAAETVEDFLHVRAVQGFLQEDGPRWEERLAAGWTTLAREELRSAAGSILARPAWPGLVRAGLAGGDELAFSRACQAAKALGIDTWDIHWRRLRERPGDPGRWYHVLELCDGGRVGDVVGLAETEIDLAAVATGAGDELGLGPAFAQHSCLDYVLQGLRRFPGEGGVLIEAGLRSPVVRNRNMAVAALAAWPREAWPAGTAEALARAAACEPKEDVRERMGKALRGEPLE